MGTLTQSTRRAQRNTETARWAGLALGDCFLVYNSRARLTRVSDDGGKSCDGLGAGVLRAGDALQRVWAGGWRGVWHAGVQDLRTEHHAGGGERGEGEGVWGTGGGGAGDWVAAAADGRAREG